MELAQGPRSFDELKTSIQVESSSIKQCITNQIRQHEENLAHKNYRQRFLDSLWYPEIYSRQERVAEAHQATFQWVYEPDDFNEPARRWYNIVHWLEKDSGIYWISGKAGSGKSTLMNFIHQDDRTSTLLGVWAGGKKVLTPGFFFWNAGTTLEKSFQGLLRSLLYQILLKAPDLTPSSVDSILFESQSPRFDTDGVQNGEPFAAWTERRLRTTFQGVMRRAKGNCHICIFIDGLDEISGDSEGVIAAVQNMQSAGVKVCLSSRPDRSYVEAFHSCAKLRLQDLTEPDIRTYVSDKLQPFLPTEFAIEVSDIMDSLVAKAQGVFIWVQLVVKALVKGLQNNDTLEQLQSRVESTPSDIEALYANMLSKIDVAHRRDAARLFQMALAGLTRSLLDVTLVLYKVYEIRSETTILKILSYCRLTQDRIPTICAGLLEVHLDDEDSAGFNDRLLTFPAGYNCSAEKDEISVHERCAHVNFIHRTAVDFFSRCNEGQQFLELEPQSCPSIHSAYVRALLAKLSLLGFPEKPADMSAFFEKKGYSAMCLDDDIGYMNACNFVHEVMRNVSLGERETGHAQVMLCNDIDSTLMIEFQRQQDISPPQHWSTWWGERLWDVENYKWYAYQVKWSSRSSSPESFHSARCESRFVLNRPVDFLGHAASYGLTCYVLNGLDLRPKHLDKDYETYLLCCCVWALCHRSARPKQFDIVAELLRRGGNPNIFVGDFQTTIWGKFLWKAPSKLSAQTAFAVTAKIFLENGADVHVGLVSQVLVPYQSLHSKPDMSFRHEMSALYVLRSRLENTTELKNLEEIVLANGGGDSHRYTHIALRKDRYRPKKIQQQKQDKLITALHASRHGYENRAQPEEVRRRWTLQLGATYEKISEIDGNSDSRTSLDGDVQSDSSGMGCFFEYPVQLGD